MTQFFIFCLLFTAIFLSLGLVVRIIDTVQNKRSAQLYKETAIVAVLWSLFFVYFN